MIQHRLLYYVSYKIGMLISTFCHDYDSVLSFLKLLTPERCRSLSDYVDCSNNYVDCSNILEFAMIHFGLLEIFRYFHITILSSIKFLQRFIFKFQELDY